MLDIFAQTYTYTTTTSSGGMSPLFWVAYTALIVLMIVGMWKIFVKAGEAGWKSLIPIYDTYILIKISGKPGWWILLLLIPFVNFVVLILVTLALAERFGKSVAFAIFGLIIFSFIGYLMLGFGDAEYTPVSGSAAAAPKAA